MTTDRQYIVDAIEQAADSYKAIRERERAFVDARVKEIQKECEALGHVYGKNLLFFGDGRSCLFCKSPEAVV